jgi:hypothetical protein
MDVVFEDFREDFAVGFFFVGFGFWIIGFDPLLCLHELAELLDVSLGGN